MGKKRRLNTAKAKFAAKHANHPRARFLAQQRAATTEEVIPSVESAAEPIVELAAHDPEPTLTVKAVEPVPAETPIAPTAKAPRKKPTAPRKKKVATVKKTASAPRKTPKRAAKKKTTSTTA
jgi:hypothetical protein